MPGDIALLGFFVGVPLLASALPARTHIFLDLGVVNCAVGSRSSRLPLLDRPSSFLTSSLFFSL